MKTALPLLSLAGALVATGAAAKTCPPNPHALPHGVESYDKTPAIDWMAQVSQQGDTFAFLKATQGGGNKQAGFPAKWAATKDAGLIRAAYHFFDPNVDGTTQAEWYVNYVKSAGGFGPGTLAMLDIECPAYANGAIDANCLGPGAGSGYQPAAVIKQRALQFLTHVEELTGKRPYLYTWVGWFYDAGLSENDFIGYDLDVPSWNDTCYSGSSILNTTFWQNNWIGQEGYDRFLGTIEELRALAGIASAALPSNDAVGAVGWPDGHTEVFARTSAGGLIQVSKVTGSWHMSSAIGDSVDCGLAPAMLKGAPAVYAANTGKIENTSWDAMATMWSPFADLGGTALGRPAVLAYPDGSVEIAALGGDGTIQIGSIKGGAPIAWSSMGGAFAVAPTGIVGADGVAHLFAVDGAGAVSHATRGAMTAPFSPIGGAIASKAVPVRATDGTITVLARDHAGHLVASRSDKGVFPAFTAIDTTTVTEGDPTLIATDAGLEAFARTADEHVVELDFDGKIWSAPAPVGTQSIASDPFAFVESDGTVELFAVDLTGNLMQAASSKGVWSTWSSIASDVDACLPKSTMSGAGGAGATVSVSAIAASSSSGAGGNAGTSNGGAAESGGGCGCSTTRDTGASGVAALAVAAALMVRRRRQRRLRVAN